MPPSIPTPTFPVNTWSLTFRNQPSLIAKWGPLMGVKVERFFLQRMKTKWGSCNHRARTVRLNTELAKKPRQCLEYIVIHGDGPLVGTHAQRSLHPADGSIHAQVAFLPPDPQPPASPA